MNPQPEQELERRLQKLEAEITPPQSPATQSQKPLQPQPDNFHPVQPNSLLDWFNDLSGLRKLLVVGVAAIVSLAIFRVLLKLVSAVISLALLAALLYFGYQFLLAPRAENKR